jgi:hypothetical protein
MELQGSIRITKKTVAEKTQRKVNEKMLKKRKDRVASFFLPSTPPFILKGGKNGFPGNNNERSSDRNRDRRRKLHSHRALDNQDKAVRANLEEKG